MKKIHKIAALLAMLLPTVVLASPGGGSTTYNYSATVNVAASGSGTVYVGAGTSATDKTQKTATQSDSNSSDTSKTYTFTVVAEPEDGYEFTGWTGGADNASSATTPVTVSLSSSTTSKTINLTATFAKVVSFDGAEYVIDENGGDLATLLSTVEAGDKIILNKDVAIEKGVSLTIPSGIQVTISAGKKLIVKGSLAIHADARLVGEGTLAHNWKTITQAADVHVPFPLGTDGVAGTGSGVNTVDGTAGKYLVTSVAEANNVSGSFTCKEEFFVTVENNASGETYYSKPSTSKPVGVLCTVAREKALNWIVGVSENVYTDYTSLLSASATTTATKTHEVKDTNQLSVLLAAAGTVTYDGSSTQSSTALGFAVDLANTSITLTTGKQWNSLKLVRFFNGSVSVKKKVMNTNFCVYNCSGTFDYLSGSSYYTAISFYDSPNVKVSWDDLTAETPAGGQNYYGGGTYKTTNAKFQTTPKTKFNTVYWGTFASGMNPTSYLYDTNKVYAEQDPKQSNAWVVKSKVVDPNAGQVLMNGEESTFADAIANAPANATIVLQKDVELSSDLMLTANGVLIDLNGWKLTGSSAIINNGDLEIIDVNGNGQIDVPIINNGTLLLSSAKYNGPITLNGGFCYFLAGTFNGGVAVASTVEDAKSVAEVCGGTYATLTYAHGGQNEELVGLCENGYVNNHAIAPIPVSYVINPSFASYSLSAFDSTTKSLYTRNAARSGYTREEWIKLCKLQAASALFSGFGVDCAVTFDRAIAANDISETAMGLYSFDIDEAIAANKSFSALFQAMRRSGMATAPWTYGAILPGGAHDGSLSFSLSNKSAQDGTLCLFEMRLATGIRNMSGPKDWSYTEYVTTAKQKLLLGNTSGNMAMIRPATGAATFYATLGAAMDAAPDGGTVMLANDCDTALALNKAGTYIFDTMGFDYSGGEPAVGSGLKIASVTTNAVDSSAKVLVPDAMTITYVVENAGTIECGETKYVSIEAAVEASSSDTIAVTVMADDTETVTLPQGKTLTVTVNDGVTANVTVEVPEGSFLETATEGTTTTYESKQITVEMEEPSAVEVVKVDHGVTNAVSDASLVNEAVHALTGNHDVSRTDNTDKLDVLDKITVKPAKIVEEVVGAETIIRSVTFDVVPHLHAGQTLGEGQTLKFRLPVAAAATQLASIVYHGDAQFGIYPVQTYDNEKFIEVESADFSPYSYELLDGETANPVAAIGTTGYATLDAAVAAAQNGDTVTLLADATLGVESIATDITLDTAGHDMTVAGPNYLYIDGDVVFTNSAYNAADPTASGVVRVTTYGVCPYTGGSLTIANGRYEQTVSTRHLFYTMGGTLVINDGSFDAPNSVVNTYVRNDGKTYGFGGTVTVNGGDFHVGTTSPQTIVRANQGATVTINGGTFDADGGYVMISATVDGNSAAPASIAVNGGTFADGKIHTFHDTSIAIDGGMFTQIEIEAWDDSSIAISGGLFDSVVPEELCAEGCIPSTGTTNIDGVEYYTVKQGAYVARNVDTGVGYETLSAAVAAAATGDTIMLLADITDYTGTTLVSKSLTINGAGHSITAAAVPEGGHRDMINAFTGGTSMLKIGGGAVTVTNITFNGHATHAYTYLIEVVNSGASLTVGDISLLNGGELDNSGTPGAGYGAGIHVNNASLVVKDGFYACTGGADYGVFPFTGILPEGDSSVMFDLVDDSDNTPTVVIGDDLLLVGMIGAIDPDTAQAILDYMQVPSRFIPYTLTLGDGSDYAFTGASPRTWNDIIDYGKEIMDVSTSLGYEGLDKESTPVEVGLLTDTELPDTFVYEDANFTVNGNGNELTGTIKYTATAGELKNVVLTSDTILDISAEGATVNFGEGVSIAEGENVKLVIGELSADQDLADNVGDLTIDDFGLYVHDAQTGNLVPVTSENIADYLPEGYEIAKVVEDDGTTKDLVVVKKKYTVSWLDDAGGEIDTTTVEHGDVPAHADAVKADSGTAFYTFAGWADTLGGSVLPALPAATNDAAYYAVFTEGAYVAQIGTTKYESIVAAFAAVPAGGTATIEMLEDVAVTNVALAIAAGQNIVLDLNGKTIDGFCNTGSNFAFITNNGTLVIQDSSDTAADGTGDGKLLFAASPAWIWDGSDNYSGSYYSDLILNSGSGEVTIRSGYVANMLPGNACYAIDMGNPAANAHIAINVEGGHIWATNTAIRVNIRKNGANDYAFHMTGGTVEGVSCAIAVNNSVAGVDVDVIIEGGTVIGRKEPYYGAIDNAGTYGCDLTITGGDFVGGIGLVGDSTADISGGTFSKNEAGNSYILFDNIESASITGGQFGDLSYWMRPLGAISGGFFATRPFNGYIAPGFFLVDNTDPTTAAMYPYTVVPAKAMVLFGTDPVTTNYYSSVVEAFTVATGKTVVMLGDETLTNAVTVSSTSTLDLAGHEIDRANGTANTEDGSVFVVDGGNLSITNSIGSGKITSTSSKGYTLWVKNNGTVSVQDGTVEAASASTSRHAIYVASGTANVSGGVVRCLQNSNAIYILSGAVNVTGGEVTTPGTAIYGSGTEVMVNVAHATVSGTGDYSYGIQLAKSSVANITNSVVSGGYAGVGATGASSVANIFHGSTVSGSVNNGVYVSSGGTANIYGGTVTGAANGAYVTKGTANVSGGTITGTGSGSYGILVDNNAGVANVSGGQIAGETSVAVASGKTGTVSLSGGVFNVAVPEGFCAEGYAPADNTDAETAAAYPYTVVSAQPTYEITWVSEGEIMATEVVASNTVPVYTGETPVKAAADTGIYTFAGWTPRVEAAVSNTTYTAKFSLYSRIRWMTGDTVVKTVSVTNGTPAAEIAALAPIGAHSSEGNARFAGWSPAYADVLGDADYIAQFTALNFLDGIVPGTLRFTSIKANGRKVAVTFEFKPTGGEADAYRLIYKTALDSAETFVSDIANVTFVRGDANSCTSIAEVTLPEACETQAFVTGLDFNEVEQEDEQGKE